MRVVLVYSTTSEGWKVNLGFLGFWDTPEYITVLPVYFLGWSIQQSGLLWHLSAAQPSSNFLSSHLFLFLFYVLNSSPPSAVILIRVICNSLARMFHLLFSPSSRSPFLFNLTFSPSSLPPILLSYSLHLSPPLSSICSILALLGTTLILYSSAFCCFSLHTLLYLLHHTLLLFSSPTVSLACFFSPCLCLGTSNSHMAYWFSWASHKHTAHSQAANVQRMHTCMGGKKRVWPACTLSGCVANGDNARLMGGREKERMGERASL